MTISSKRAEYISLLSLILSVIFFVIALLLGRWSGFTAVYNLSWLSLSSVLIWLVLVIQFHQRALAEQERLDISQLGGDEKSSAIFQAKREHSDLFAVSQHRLQVLEKWFLPIFAGIIAAYQAVIGFYLSKTFQSGREVELQQPLLCAIFMTAIAFVSFLISRYATGMSAQAQWKPLRAGGSILLGTAVLSFALAIGLALAQFNIFIIVNIIKYVIPVLLIILGVETALNVVLDIYRPRLKGQYERAAFDSRLLGLINEPGEIFRTAASAIDYQFGFQVSQTWFYKLLEKAIVPLVLFAAVTLYLMSSVVIIEPNEQAIIEHFGNPHAKADQVRHAGPGLHLKWPWPIDVAYKYPTEKISEISIGFIPKTNKDTEQVGYGPLLWGQSHYEQEYQLLVASEQTTSVSAAGAAPVSLVMAAVPVQYRIKDLYSFIYNHDEPEEMLKSICYRELTEFAAGVTIEVDTPKELEHSLFGAGRDEAKQILTKRIQQAVDKEGLGVEIVFLGLQGIHPPPEVAANYQQVIGAVQKQQALILGAQAERNRTLSTLVGSVEEADSLFSLAQKYQQIKDANNIGQTEKEKIAHDLDLAFEQAKGSIFTTLKEALSYAFERATLAKSTGQRFASRLKAYNAAKEIYKHEQRLAVLEEALGQGNIRKYVVVSDPNDSQVYIFDFQEKSITSLYDIEGFQESSTK
jgi:membrane protease subunit HflK